MRSEVHWPYRRMSTTDLPLLSETGEIVRFRDLEGVGGRPELHRQVWSGSVADFIDATGVRPFVLVRETLVDGEWVFQCHRAGEHGTALLRRPHRRGLAPGPWTTQAQPAPLRVETGWGHACGGDHPREVFATGTAGLVTFRQPPGSEEPCGVEPIDGGWQVVHDRPGGGIVLWGYESYDHARAGAAALALACDWANRDDWPPNPDLVAHVKAMGEAGL